MFWGPHHVQPGPSPQSSRSRCGPGTSFGPCHVAQCLLKTVGIDDVRLARCQHVGIHKRLTEPDEGEGQSPELDQRREVELPHVALNKFTTPVWTWRDRAINLRFGSRCDQWSSVSSGPSPAPAIAPSTTACASWPYGGKKASIKSPSPRTTTPRGLENSRKPS